METEFDLTGRPWTKARNGASEARPTNASSAKGLEYHEVGWFEPLISCALLTMVLSAALAGARADAETFCAIMVALVGAATVVRSELGFGTLAGGRWEAIARGAAVTLSGILMMTAAMLFLLT